MEKEIVKELCEKFNVKENLIKVMLSKALCYDYTYIQAKNLIEDFLKK